MDLKYEYQKEADELAWKKYGKEFYDLTDKQQIEVWSKAETEVDERLQEAADILRDELLFSKWEKNKCK